MGSIAECERVGETGERRCHATKRVKALASHPNQWRRCAARCELSGNEEGRVEGSVDCAGGEGVANAIDRESTTVVVKETGEKAGIARPGGKRAPCGPWLGNAGEGVGGATSLRARVLATASRVLMGARGVRADRAAFCEELVGMAECAEKVGGNSLPSDAAMHAGNAADQAARTRWHIPGRPMSVGEQRASGAAFGEVAERGTVYTENSVRQSLLGFAVGNVDDTAGRAMPAPMGRPCRSACLWGIDRVRKSRERRASHG